MKPIGGYFELELRKGIEYHQNALRLNTGRNAFEYILRSKGYKKAYLPYYICESMLEPIKKLNLDYEYYTIDSDFFPVFDFKRIINKEAFLYVNYFGICDKQVEDVVKKCNNTIIDNSQAFFSKPPEGIDTFYSPRKFFGIPDGAYLYTDKQLSEDLEQDVSLDRFSHLIGRIEKGPEAYYSHFKQNNLSLEGSDIKIMSKLSGRLLDSIDYKKVVETRKNNFDLLHSKLHRTNMLKIDLGQDSIPMVYPYLIEQGEDLKRKLIENKVFVPTYWPNVMEWCNEDQIEYLLAKDIVPLPVDQRYSKSDLLDILRLI